VTIKILRFEDNLWYPIVIKSSENGPNQIVEMQGKAINAWNDAVRKSWLEDTKNHPRGWRI